MKFYKIYIIALMLILTISSYAQVVVVANKSVPDGSINSSKLGDTYTLKSRTWSNGQGIVLFTLKDDNTANKCFGSFGKSSAELKKLWMKLQLTGEGNAPEAISSDEEILNKVASTPGAVGFVNAGKVNDKVKVLLTIN